jgi:O-antigen ligase
MGIDIKRISIDQPKLIVLLLGYVLGCALVALVVVSGYPELLAMLAVVVAAGLVAALNLRLALYAIVFLIPWQIYLVNWPNSTYTFRFVDILIGFTLGVTLLKFPKSMKLMRTRWMLPLWGFLILAVGSGFVNGDVYETSKFLGDWGPSVAFYWLLLAWGDMLNREKLLKVFLFSFVLQAALGILQTVIGDPQLILSFLRSPGGELFFDRDLLAVRAYNESLNFIWGDRVYAFGTYLGASGLGLALALASTILWSFVIRSRRLFGSWDLYLAILLNAACLLTLKRSGWLALVAGMFVMIILAWGSKAFKRPRFVAVISLVIIGAGVFVYLHGDIISDRVTDQIGWQFGRENTWPVYFNLFTRHPFFGYGPGYPLGSQAIGLSAFDYGLGPDNTYLHIALTAGIPGLLSFLWLVAYAVWQLWHLRRGGDPEVVIAITAGLAALSVGGMFVIALGDLQNSGSLFFLLALAHTYVRASRQETTFG